MVRTIERVGESSTTRPVFGRNLLADDRLLLAFVLSFALIVRLISVFSIPPWQSPDEPKHFEYIRTLIDKQEVFRLERRLPRIEDSSPQFQGQIIASMAKNHYWEYFGLETPAPLPASFYAIWRDTSTQLHRPSMYYLLGAIFLYPFQNFELEDQLRVVRLLSVIFSTITIAITYYLAKQIVPNDRFIHVGSAFFVAALPMHIFIGSSVNNDNLLTMVGSLAILSLTLILRRGFSVKRCVFLLSMLVLALATKRAAVGLLPGAMAAVIFGLLSWKNVSRRFLFGSGLMLAALILVFTVGRELAKGFLPFDILNRSLVAYALNGSDHLDNLLKVSVSTPEVQHIITGHLILFFRSFWGIFGWFNLPLSEELYLVLAIVSVVCFIGYSISLTAQIATQLRPSNGSRQFAPILVQFVFLVAIISMAVLAEGERLAYLSPGEIPQGRYLFNVVAPIAIVYAIGARTLLVRRFLRTGLPTLAVVLSLIVLDLIVYLDCLRPFYIERVFS